VLATEAGGDVLDSKVRLDIKDGGPQYLRGESKSAEMDNSTTMQAGRVLLLVPFGRSLPLLFAH
jgi:hypothetical protein